MRTDRPETAGGGSRGGSGIVKIVIKDKSGFAKIKQATRNTQIRNENKRLTDKPTKAEAKANARALKAANKPTKASKNPDIKKTKSLANVNKSMGQKEPYATRNAARTVDAINKLPKSKSSIKDKAKNIASMKTLIGSPKKVKKSK